MYMCVQNVLSYLCYIIQLISMQKYTHVNKRLFRNSLKNLNIR